MCDDRYQFQPWIVKAWRWLQWRPLYFVLACLWMPVAFVAVWFVDPWPCQTRWETLASVWRQFGAKAEYRMGHWWTLDEIIDDLAGQG